MLRTLTLCCATIVVGLALCASAQASCDPIDPAACLYPWPNDHFTAADRSADTGLRVNLGLTETPRNRYGKPIDPAPYNLNDGFSPGSLIVTKVPGLDTPQAFEKTGAVPIDDMGRSFDRDQPIVLINARTGKRQLIWSELDSNPANPGDVTLLIHPGKNLAEGQRFIVALRNLKDAGGHAIQPQAPFKALRDGVTHDARYDRDIWPALKRGGIPRGDLYLAWDFTVASERNLSERMLHIRDDAFAQLGDRNLADLKVPAASRAPAIVPGSLKVTDYTPQEDSRIARSVEGRISVPCYLDLPGCVSGGRFRYGADGLPLRNPVDQQAAFTCHVPRVALEPGAPPARVSLYGHGLLGSRGEIGQGQLKDFGQEHNIVFCATDWSGMACADTPTSPDDVQAIAADVAAGHNPNLPNCDIPAVLSILNDLSGFPMLADRVQQGMLDFLYLGRLMIHPAGLSALPAFQQGGKSILDTRRLFYDGNSQGGIIGGALAAVAVDNDRSALGVPGMNYSTLLSRSVDFDTYAEGNFEGVETPLGMYDAYPNELERPLILSLIQNLWDRAEADGYAEHMTSDPYPNTPRHKVLMQVAFGDHQVANIAAEVEARTIGARAYQPALEPGRASVETLFGIPPIGSFPFDGSAIVYWDSGPMRTEAGQTVGTPPPPLGNVAPARGEDPHELPRREPEARAQKSEFLKIGGHVIDACGGQPCRSGTWDDR